MFKNQILSGSYPATVLGLTAEFHVPLLVLI